jgi:predicted TIM-barrel fold metal-dependent hydrolase
MVIDSHTHFFPSEIACDPVAWARDRGEAHWLQLMAPEGKHSLQSWPSLDRFIADMDEAGVDRVILQGWYWENPHTCEWHNQFYLDCVQQYPDRLSATSSFHLDVSSDPAAWLESWLDRGMIGVGELLPQVQGSTMLDPRWGRVCAMLAERDAPLLFHVTETIGRDHPGKIPTPYHEIGTFLHRYPDVSVVLAHWAGQFSQYALEHQVNLERVWVDTAASPLLYKPEIFQQFPQQFPRERILFGSDYPMRVYPKRQREAEMKLFLEEARSYTQQEQHAGLLGENAMRVYKLKDR